MRRHDQIKHKKFVYPASGRKRRLGISHIGPHNGVMPESKVWRVTHAEWVVMNSKE